MVNKPGGGSFEAEPSTAWAISLDRFHWLLEQGKIYPHKTFS